MSAEEEPRREPSSENFTEEIAALWPVRVSVSLYRGWFFGGGGSSIVQTQD